MTKNKNNNASEAGQDYRIIIREMLDDSWEQWFGPATVVTISCKDGQRATLLTCRIADQAALNGLLNKIWGLNLTVISVEQLPGCQPSIDGEQR